MNKPVRKFIPAEERHPLAPVCMAIDAFWQREEQMLFAAHAQHVANIDASIARIDAALESYRAVRDGGKMTQDTGVAATPPGHSNEPASGLAANAGSVPNADTWFCNKGGFWGTVKQFCLCAKCGRNEIKRHDEPRHFGGIFTSRFHTLCDDCFNGLPDDGAIGGAA